MPDLLTHTLLAYTLGMVFSWRYDWLTPQYVTVAMAGAFIPDLAKIGLVIPRNQIAALLGVPFNWFGIHTLGGVLLAALIGVVFVTPTSRRRVFALLSLGAGSHLLIDAFLVKVSGHSYPLLWPLTTYAPPTPGLYLSTDVLPAVVMGLIAGGVWFVDRSLGLARPTEQS